MKLGFDIDGIVADMAGAMIAAANKEFGMDYTVEIFKRHNIFKAAYTDDLEENHKIAQFMVDNVIHSEDALENLIEPYPEAADALRHLRKTGHTLHFITARKEEEFDATVNWFRKHKIPFDTIHNTGSVPKGLTGRSLNLDFYIDDQDRHLKNMYQYKNRWRKGLGLYTRPWNAEKVLDQSKYIRFSGWDEIIRHIGIHNR